MAARLPEVVSSRVSIMAWTASTTEVWLEVRSSMMATLRSVTGTLWTAAQARPAKVRTLENFILTNDKGLVVDGLRERAGLGLAVGDEDDE